MISKTILYNEDCIHYYREKKDYEALKWLYSHQAQLRRFAVMLLTLQPNEEDDEPIHVH